MSAEFGRNSVEGARGSFTEPVARPFEGRRMTYGVEFGVFCFAVQRYVELSGFSKLFGEKMQKTCIVQCRDDKMRCFYGLKLLK